MSAASAIRGGWTPVSDWAMIAAGSSETLSRDPMLVGQPTSLGVVAGEPLSHPGPLLYWALGVPVALLGPPGHGVVVGAVIVNVASLVALAVLLGRFRQPLFLLAGGVSIAFLIGEVEPSFLRDPFNPTMALLPTAVAAVALASILAGHAKAAVVLVLFGSFAAQAHVAAVHVIGVILVVAVIAMVWRGWWGRSTSTRQAARRWLWVSGGVGLACWIGPLVDQVAGEGNLWGLVSGGRSDEVIGLGGAARRLVTALATPPPLGDPQRPRLTEAGGRQWEVGTVHIWELGVAVGALVCVALLLALGVRRQRALLAAFAMTALVTVGGVALMTSQLPSTSGFVVRAAAPANNLAWVLAAVLVWVTIVGGFTHVVATDINAVRVGIQLIHRRRRLVAALGAATLTVVVVGSAAVTPLDPSDDPGSILWGPARLHAAAIDDAILPATPVVLEVEPETNAAFRLMVPTLVGQLQVRGIDAYYRAAWPGGWLPGLIPRYEVTTAPPGAASVVLRIGPHALDEVAGYTRLSSYDPANPPPRYSANDTPLLRYGREPTAVDLAPDAERSAE